MKAFLIDFENVKSKGLQGIDMLDKNDKVIIFYSENSDTISFEMHQNVINSPANVEYLKVRVGGKNALDFQLATLLGYIVAKDEYSHIFIISNDKGFEKLHDFWKTNYCDEVSCLVFRTQTILSACDYYNANTVNDDNEKSSDNNVESQTSEVQTTAEKSQNNNVIASNSNSASVQKSAQNDNVVQLPIEILNEEIELAMTSKTNNNAPAISEVKITKIPAKRVNATPQKPASMQIRNSLLGFFDFTNDDIDNIKDSINVSESKEDFHNLLAKNYKNSATDLYKILRPKYLRLKALISEEKNAEAETQIPENDIPAESAVNTAIIENDEIISTIAEEELQELPEHEELHSEVEKLLPDDFSHEDIDEICGIINTTDTKQRLYISIIKKYKKDKGCEIYNCLKPEYNSLITHKHTV